MGIYISLLSVPSHLKPYTEGATTMAANARTRTKDGCNLIPSSKLNRMCKDLMTRKHNLAEGGTPEEIGVYKCTLYSSLRKPESCEETLDVCWLVEQWIYLNPVHDQEEFLQCS